VIILVATGVIGVSSGVAPENPYTYVLFQLIEGAAIISASTI
jgi:hypothetical protein